LPHWLFVSWANELKRQSNSDLSTLVPAVDTRDRLTGHPAFNLGWQLFYGLARLQEDERVLDIPVVDCLADRLKAFPNLSLH